MCRHYKRPILLIEFDESKSFSLQVISVYASLCMDVTKLLQSTSTIQGEISNQSVASKLVLLTLHFPNVLLIDMTHQSSLYTASYVTVAVETPMVFWFVCNCRSFQNPEGILFEPLSLIKSAN